MFSGLHLWKPSLVFSARGLVEFTASRSPRGKVFAPMFPNKHRLHSGPGIASSQHKHITINVTIYYAAVHHNWIVIETATNAGEKVNLWCHDSLHLLRYHVL